jgi:hypothetical protein
MRPNMPYLLARPAVTSVIATSYHLANAAEPIIIKFTLLVHRPSLKRERGIIEIIDGNFIGYGSKPARSYRFGFLS